MQYNLINELQLYQSLANNDKSYSGQAVPRSWMDLF